ncbi:MAG: NADH-quinone oxidoreductase subunit J [bacterium]
MVIAFYILAFLTVGSAFAVLLLRSPVYCALSLVACFFFLAAIFVLLNQEFVAAIQILIYAGAIMVLFLFVIMLLNLKAEGPFAPRPRVPQILGIVLSAGLLAQLVGLFSDPKALLGPSGTYTAERVTEEGSIEIIGRLLFVDYVLPFEVISVLLMVSVMGAVVLAKRRPPREPGRGEEQ